MSNHDTTVTRLLGYRLTQVVEALVFAADEPVTPRHLAEVYEQVTGEARPTLSDVEEAVDTLNEELASTGRVVRIHRWGGGYRMATIQEVEPFLQAHLGVGRRQRLSRTLMETLAILAYRQPVTKPEVDFVRGVDSDYAIRRLLEMGFVDVVGRSESVGRPLLYGTTPRFLEQFGLRDLDGLPTLREIEELLQDPSFSKERAQLLALAQAAEGQRAKTNADEDKGEDDPAVVDSDASSHAPPSKEPDEERPT